jgi:putative spermidine/putrescine transport system permease protein
MIKEIPFVMLLVLGMLQRFPFERLLSAKMLGAGSWRRFTTILFPFLTPVVHTSFIILFLYSFGAYDIPALLSESRPQMLPITVYNIFFNSDLSQRPKAMAILTVMFIFAAVFVAIYSFAAGKIDRTTRKI